MTVLLHVSTPAYLLRMVCVGFPQCLKKKHWTMICLWPTMSTTVWNSESDTRCMFMSCSHLLSGSQFHYHNLNTNWYAKPLQRHPYMLLLGNMGSYPSRDRHRCDILTPCFKQRRLFCSSLECIAVWWEATGCLSTCSVSLSGVRGGGMS